MPDKDHIKALLIESITVLCNNSIPYQIEVEVEGLLGFTVDKSDAFLVGFKEIFSEQFPEAQGNQQQQPEGQQYDQLQFTPSHYSLRNGQNKGKLNEGPTIPKVASNSPHQSQIKELLSQAVALLCRDNITYEKVVKVEGLVGITIDKEQVLLVTLKQVICGHTSSKVRSGKQLNLNRHSPSPSKRKRKCKLAESSPSPKVLKTVSDQSPEQSQVTAEVTFHVVKDHQEGPIGMIEYVEQNALTEQNIQDSPSDSNDTEQMTHSSNVDGIVEIIPQNEEDSNEVPGGIKLEKSYEEHNEDFGLYSFDIFPPEEKWDASFGIMQQDDGVVSSEATFSLPQLDLSVEQSGTQVNYILQLIFLISPIL